MHVQPSLFKLIKVALPLPEINDASAYEQDARHRVHPLPQSSQGIVDDFDARLVVLGPDKPGGAPFKVQGNFSSPPQAAACGAA